MVILISPASQFGGIFLSQIFSREFLNLGRIERILECSSVFSRKSQELIVEIHRLRPIQSESDRSAWRSGGSLELSRPTIDMTEEKEEEFFDPKKAV